MMMTAMTTPMRSMTMMTRRRRRRMWRRMWRMIETRLRRKSTMRQSQTGNHHQAEK